MIKRALITLGLFVAGNVLIMGFILWLEFAVWLFADRPMLGLSIFVSPFILFLAWTFSGFYLKKGG